MKTIDLPLETFTRLEKLAQGFDTPANVIDRLLNHYEQVEVQNVPQEISGSVKKDTTKYLFNDGLYGKGKLVLAVVKQYVQDHPGTTLAELNRAFPKHLQGSIGVFNKLSYVTEKYRNIKMKRHYVEPHDNISCDGTNIVVSTEWGIGNINDFIEQATALGYSITPKTR